jgi:hypothetical protein
MCSGKHQDKALRQYDFALQLAESKYALLRRGALHVALQDLDLAVEKSQLGRGERVEKVRHSLEKALSEATAAAEETLQDCLEKTS